MGRPPKNVTKRKDGRFASTLRTTDPITGKKTKKFFYSEKSKSDAERKKEEYKVNEKVSKTVEAFGIALAPSKSKSFEECAMLWLEKYKKGNVKSNTYKTSYLDPTEKYIIPYFKDKIIGEILPYEIKDFYSKMSERFYETTLHKIKNCLNAIFRMAIDNGWCGKNPAENINYTVKKVGEKKRSYSEEQEKTIEEFAYTHKYGLYILLMLKLGLRCSELCGLKFSDFDYKKKTLFVQRAVTKAKGGPVIGKTKNEASHAIIPVYSPIIKLVEEYSKNAQSEFLLTTRNGRLNDDSYFSKTLYKTFFIDLQKVHPEIPKYTPHELRHTCGTLLYSRKQDIYSVSKFLRHSNVEITAKIYIHEKTDTIRDHLEIY